MYESISKRPEQVSMNETLLTIYWMNRLQECGLIEACTKLEVEGFDFAQDLVDNGVKIPAKDIPFYVLGIDDWGHEDAGIEKEFDDVGMAESISILINEAQEGRLDLKEINSKRLSELLQLTDKQVMTIVKEWYLNDTEDIFQNEDGEDLEEYIDGFLYQ